MSRSRAAAEPPDDDDVAAATTTSRRRPDDDDVAAAADSERAERAVLRKCIVQAVWSRAFPAAVVGGASMYLAVRSGRLKAHARYGPWPKVAGFSLVSYLAGQLSYIVSNACKDVFLRDAPDSEVAYFIREGRGLPNAPELRRRYGGGGGRDGGPPARTATRGRAAVTICPLHRRCPAASTGSTRRM